MALSGYGLNPIAYIPPNAQLVLEFQSAGVDMIYNLTPVLFAALPAASAALKGARAMVSDVTTGTFAATVVGSGSLCRPVFCDGTNWVVG
jgi:hypothetical protein